MMKHSVSLLNMSQSQVVPKHLVFNIDNQLQVLNSKNQQYKSMVNRPRSVLSAKWHRPSCISPDNNLVPVLPQLSQRRQLLISHYLKQQGSINQELSDATWAVKFEIMQTKINQQIYKLNRYTDMQPFNYLQLLGLQLLPPIPFLQAQKQNNFTQTYNLLDYVIELETIYLSEQNEPRKQKLNSFRKTISLFLPRETKNQKPAKEFIQDLIDESKEFVEEICAKMNCNNFKTVQMIEIHILLENNAQEAFQQQECVENVLEIVKDLRKQRENVKNAMNKRL
ncbi:Hypothetical_protein [Hexamita inflata]|uniref:Hypothetical_protein n=1 Tax=Hexamita inflata TaxID=28002 RepID=A0AA86RIZ1_9EUKA|nr:Hypothetical protein HINF_LOCUS55420 [Hexamita inflata]